MSAPGWVSTRSPGEAPVAFSEAMLRGLAPDGGLYVPVGTPEIDPGPAELFADHAVSVLLPWLTGFLGEADVETAVRSALDFPVPLVRLSPDLHVLELFHGPTASFKDFGARTMARLLAGGTAHRGRPLTVFVATSGDTGSAVADGFAGLEGLSVVLLYPAGQVSATQERQMLRERDGVTVIQIRGAFDDCQRLVKGVFADPRFAAMNPTSANSINVARLVSQTCYHAWAAALVPGCTVVVPSGNLGNLTAGVLSRRSGAPIDGFVAAHNANRAFPDYLAGGPLPDRPSIRTLSNAMDVGLPSNFERLLFMLGDANLRNTVVGASVSDEETLASIRDVAEAHGYVCDPHTAVGLEAARRRKWTGGRGPFVVLATAHPGKFPESVARALALRPEDVPALGGRNAPSIEAIVCDASLDALHAVLTGADPGPELSV